MGVGGTSTEVVVVVVVAVVVVARLSPLLAPTSDGCTRRS